MRKIFIITDSYGGERKYGHNIIVPLEKTFPYLISEKLKNKYDVEFSAGSFRKMTEIAELLKKNTSSEIYIIQAGIVDCFPRPLSQKRTISQSFLNKSCRKIIRANRRFFIKYVRNKPWTTQKEFQNCLETIGTTLTKKQVLFIGIAPVNKRQNQETPGANANIVKYNTMIESACNKFKFTFVDIYKLITSENDYESFLINEDSHLNCKGNEFYYKQIISNLGE